MTKPEFSRRFKELTGHEPLPWQWRLFAEHFLNGALCDRIDVPTGLGKTMIMAIWWIAWETKHALPRRLVYVVDRRTVVDQATHIACNIQNVVGDSILGLSTLRGRLADNREWSQDLSQPAIIIGTVDLIGSALLFSGYRSSFKRRPLEGGLLGQDSLLVLDEAHLSRPFEKLLDSIGQFQRAPGTPMRVIRMSATSDDTGGTESETVFRLDTDSTSANYDLTPDPDPATATERNLTIRRFRASKRLTIEEPVESRKLNDALADAAIRLASDASLVGKRIVVFVRSPNDVKAIAKKIADHATPNKSKANPEPKGPYAGSVDVLTGTIRGFERDALVKTPVFEKRWLNGNLSPSDDLNSVPVFLVSNSAGEVGFDLNADHMVSGETSLESFIQRLGRVNRRGDGDAAIVLIPEVTKQTEKAAKPRKPDGFAIANTLDLLAGQTAVSPENIDSLKKGAWKDRYNAACSSPPPTLELTDILLDAWSMTSITGRMPGRPDVGPWLRGVAEELPQTTVAWRAELDLFKDHPAPEKALKAIFAKHSIRPHESLTTNSYRVAEFLKQAVSPATGQPELRDVRIAVKLGRDILWKTIGELADESGILNADPTLIFPPSFGGLDKGMLAYDAIRPPPRPDDPKPPSLDVADEPGYEAREDDKPRLRIVIERTEDGWRPLSVPGGRAIATELNLAANYEKSTPLFKSLLGSGLRVRLVQPIDFDDEGNPQRSLVLLAPLAHRSRSNEPELLSKHVCAVEVHAARIAQSLSLDDLVRQALTFAAKWHDEGKKADIWQRFIKAEIWQQAIGGSGDDEPIGKAPITRDPKTLEGYRHEFGSLMRLCNPEHLKTAPSLPEHPEVRDLVLHLIATHHGFGRPHFDSPFDRDFKEEQCDEMHLDAVRRFCRLQRKYGWWRLAWLENLLRCADALASGAVDAEDDDADRSEI